MQPSTPKFSVHWFAKTSLAILAIATLGAASDASADFKCFNPFAKIGRAFHCRYEFGMCYENAHSLVRNMERTGVDLTKVHVLYVKNLDGWDYHATVRYGDKIYDPDRMPSALNSQEQLKVTGTPVRDFFATVKKPGTSVRSIPARYYIDFFEPGGPRQFQYTEIECGIGNDGTCFPTVPIAAYLANLPK